MAGFFSSFVFLVFVVVFSGLAYYQGLGPGLVFDSIGRIAENKNLHIENWEWGALWKAATSHDSLLGRPIPTASFALNYYFCGLKPACFKAVNLALHFLSALSIYGLTFGIVSALERQGKELGRRAPWAAFTVAALWVLAPIQLVAVLYVVQRMASMAALFVLLGAGLYVYGRLVRWKGGQGWGLILGGVLGCGALAALSKENGVLLLPLVLLLEGVVFRFQDRNGELDRPVTGFHSVLWVAAVATISLLLGMKGFWIFDGYARRPWDMSERFLTQFRILWHYVAWVLTPNSELLTLWHDDIPISRGWMKPWTTIPAVLGWLVVVFVAIALRNRLPLVTLGLGWYLVGHTLESSVIPLELVHEHRNYLPSFGLFLALWGLTGSQVTSPIGQRVVAVGLAFIAILYWDGLAARAVKWQDPLTRAAMDIRQHPESLRARNEAITQHLAFAKNDINPYLHAGKAYVHARKAMGMDSAKLVPEGILLEIHFRFGTPLPEGTVSRLIKKASHYPIAAEDIRILKELYYCQVQGACRLPDERFLRILGAFIDKPTDKPYLDSLSVAWRFRGRYLAVRMGKLDEGKAVLERAVRRFPGHRPLLLDLAEICIFQENWQSAEKALNVIRSKGLGSYRDRFLQLKNLIEQGRD